MIKCKYIYRGHTFNSELELDQFLLTKEQYVSEYGDLVFLRSSIQMRMRKDIERFSSDAKKAHHGIDTYGEDGEVIHNMKGEFIGVRKFIDMAPNDAGERMVPEFIENNYWKAKHMLWTHGAPGMPILSDGTLNGQRIFTQEEMEMIFNGQQPCILSKEEANRWTEVIQKKWNYQGKAGTAWHKIMQTFFLTNPTDSITFYHLLQKDDDLKILDDNVLLQTASMAFDIRQLITNLLGTDLDFYPEVDVSARIASSPILNKNKLYGIIDLLVIDGKGNSYVFDYKTSPKDYAYYSSAKQLSFDYQLAFYRQILETYGLFCNKQQYGEFIIPITLTDFTLTNRDEIATKCMNNESVDDVNFNFSGVSFDTIQNISNNIRVAHQHILPTVREYLPVPERKTIDAGDSMTYIQNGMEQFGFSSTMLKHRTLDEVRDQLDAAGALTPIDGYYKYTLFGAVIEQDATEDNAVASFVKKVYSRYEYMANKVPAAIDVCIDAIEHGITEGTTDVSEQLAPLFTGHGSKDKRSIEPDWFQNYLIRYCDPKYQIIECKPAQELGVLFILNKNTSLIDIIKLSSRDPTWQHYQKDSHNKNIEGRSNLTYAFEDDIKEDSKKNSLMLKATTSNIEYMEVMLLINSLKDELADYQIGNIRVMNPFKGIGGALATNAELLYCFNKLMSHTENLTNNMDSIHFASLTDICLNDFKDAMSSSDGRYSLPVSSARQLAHCANALNTADSELSKSQKISIISEIIARLSKEQGDTVHETSGITNEADFRAHILNEALLARAELNDTIYRQQLLDHDNWCEYKSFSGILTKGMTGNMLDNPGQLSSTVLNTMTEGVNRAYQRIRDEMQQPIAELRKQTEKIKKEKHFSSFFGNSASLYSNMFYTDNNGDLLFKNPDTDNSLTATEKEFLNYALNIINKNRYPDEDIDDMRKRKDILYFRVPLAKGNFESDVATRGLVNSLVTRLKAFTPKEAMKQLREATEGIFEPEIKNSRGQNLFELSTKFDQMEDGKARLNALKKLGEGYFEHNLETLLLDHQFAYISKKSLDAEMPMIRAAMTYLAVLSSATNTSFSNDLNYAKNYIKAAIKKLPLTDNPSAEATTALMNKIKGAASFCALAFSPVLSLYQGLLGIWQDISLIIRKPDGTEAFTWANFLKAFKFVYKDLVHGGSTPTKCQLLNEKFGINDMDMTDYSRHIIDKTGLFNFQALAFKMSSRPDYYNRMSIVVAKMIADGSWDAYSVEDGKLVYDWKKDKRYAIFALNKVDDPLYQYQRSLYYQNLKLFQIENRINTDISFNENYPDLPDAYTTLEMESTKSLCDLIYGYYSGEKKSLMHYTLIGSLFMQMKTYWSGKKNQYLQSGGVKVRGYWQQVEEDGKKYFYRVDDYGNAFYDEPPVTEDQLRDTDIRIPVVQWHGLWQEGIALTMAEIWRQSYLDRGEGNFFKGLFYFIPEIYSVMNDTADPMLRKVYRANIRQLITDISMFLIIGNLIGAIWLKDLEKELEKEARKSNLFSDGVAATAANILAQSVSNSASDFWFVGTIGNPFMQWTPFSLETVARLSKNIWTTTFGDRTIYGGLINTFSVTKMMKPMLRTIAPLTEEKE